MLTLARVLIERTRKDRRGENRRRLYNLRERFSAAQRYCVDKPTPAMSI